MRRKQITGADLLSELHSYNGNDKRYSESNGNYQESETAADYAMKKLKAHYGVEDQDNNEDIAQLAQSGLQKLEQYYGTRNQMSSVNTIQSGIKEGQNRYFTEDSKLPTSSRIIQTMDDRAIEEALKIAKERMQTKNMLHRLEGVRRLRASTSSRRNRLTYIRMSLTGGKRKKSGMRIIKSVKMP